jgi:hypothetical protein
LAFADGFQDPTNGTAIPTAPATPTALVAAVRNFLLAQNGANGNDFTVPLQGKRFDLPAFSVKYCARSRRGESGYRSEL